MSRSGYVLRRVAFALLSLFAVVTVTYLFVTVVPSKSEAAFAPNAGSVTLRQLVDGYVTWLGNVATLHFGGGDGRLPTFRSAMWATLTYVVPAVLLSLVVGLGLGVAAAMNHNDPFDRLSSVGSYLALGVPDFWIGQALLWYCAYRLDLFGKATYDQSVSPLAGVPVLTEHLLLTFVFPVFVLTSSLVAAQHRYARTAALESVGSDFVKLVRAKGAGPLRVGRHLVRNAAVLLVSLFFAETLAVLVVDVFVLETVFGIEGVGRVAYFAIQSRNTGLVLGTVVAFGVFGVLGNLLQDVAYAYLDPRIEAE